jgi:hypothetical protein
MVIFNSYVKLPEGNEFQCGERCWSIGFFFEVPIFQGKPIASKNHRTCKLSRSWNPCASFLHCDSSRMRKNTRASSMAMALAMPPWITWAVGCRGSQCPKLGSQKIHVPRGGLRIFCKFEPLPSFFLGASKLSEPTNLNNSVHNSQRWLAGPIWTHLDPPTFGGFPGGNDDHRDTRWGPLNDG